MSAVRVELSRPERRNAVDGATAAELADAFREFDADPEAAVAVLHGEGGVFCAGADLHAAGTAEGNRVDPSGDGPMGSSRMVLSKPVIAAVEGYAVAGGLELALWCDLRVASESAVFGVFCRRWGVPLIDGGTVRLPRLIGASRALDLVLTGRPVAAAEALEIGLDARPPRSWRASSPSSRRPACERTAFRCFSRWGWSSTPRWPTSSSTVCARWPMCSRVLSASGAARAATGSSASPTSPAGRVRSRRQARRAGIGRARRACPLRG